MAERKFIAFPQVQQGKLPSKKAPPSKKIKEARDIQVRVRDQL